MRMTKTCLVVLGALALGACNSTTDEVVDSAITADAPAETLFYLANGQYKVLTVTNIIDDCQIGLASLQGVGFPLTIDNITGETSYGNLQGTPAVASFGSGLLSHNAGILTMATKITAASPSLCTFDRTVTSNLTMTGNYTFSLNVSRTDSNRATACDTEAETTIGLTCTSTWSMTVTKDTTIDAGT
jgi:hypothetical protein